MSITSSGLVCDICGKYILPLFDETYERFSCKGIAHELQCHIPCKQAIVDAGKEWEKLPDGPLRQAFEKAMTPTQPVGGVDQSGEGR
jgi:hypothetical protein